MRILLESLLIDLNEEMYELSEELSKSYQNDQLSIYCSKSHEFEKRTSLLVKRIRSQVDSNQAVKTIRKGDLDYGLGKRIDGNRSRKSSERSTVPNSRSQSPVNMGTSPSMNSTNPNSI